MPPVTMPHRYESLDWLRGLLALSILLYHVVSWETAPLDASTLLGKLGAYGVSMFFILSGLSIAIAYHRFIVDAPSSARFFVRRVFRIWPLLWVAILVLSAARMAQGEPFSWFVIILNLTTLFGFVSPTSYVNTGAWSIGNEMVYYAMTPALILAYNRSMTLGNLVTGAAMAVGAYFAIECSTRGVTSPISGVPTSTHSTTCSSTALASRSITTPRRSDWGD